MGPIHPLFPHLPLAVLGLLLTVPLSIHSGSGCQQSDADGDGWTVADGDCDDEDPAVNPGAEEVCDGLDNDCNGYIDDGAGDPYYPDLDGDFFSGSSVDPVVSCTAVPGYTRRLGDCDEADPTLNPGMAEACNGIDDDCDGWVDEEAPGAWYRDADGDGFGTESEVRCLEQSGFVQARGDCDDLEAEVHAGAADSAGDGSDSDCGGSDDPEPHVGLSSGSRATLQQALEEAEDGATVWVGPGEYLEHDLSFDGKRLVLKSTHFAALTLVNCKGDGRGFIFEQGEGPDSELNGFTITDGYGSQAGGGIRVDGASPTLRGCTFTNNVTSAGGEGGALFFSESASVVIGCVLSENLADTKIVEYTSMGTPYTEIYPGYGGGLYATNSQLLLGGSKVTGNAAWRGGAIYVTGSVLTMLGTTVEENTAQGQGGGLSAYDTVLEATGVVVNGNDADTAGGVYLSYTGGTFSRLQVTGNHAAGNGGGMYLWASSPDITGANFSGNDAGDVGGGLYLYAASPKISSSLFLRNTAFNRGGAMSIEDGGPTLTFCTLAGNASTYEGAGLYLASSSSALVLQNSLLLNNHPYNVWHSSSSPDTFDITYSDLYNSGLENHNLASLDATNLTVDPLVIAWSNDSDNDDLHLEAGSPLIDAGAPDLQDPDGSRADIGVYGGPGADFAYYADADGDGMYDGWEQRHGLDPGVNDAGGDPDGDGLANAVELGDHTDPAAADTDADGVADPAELEAGSDPLDPFAVPGGTLPRRVPEDYASIGAAIYAIPSEGTVEIAPGTYREVLAIYRKQIVLVGTGGASSTLVEGDGLESAVLTGVDAGIDVSGLTLQNGNSSNGGGISLTDVTGTLSDLVVQDNTATNGGGVYLSGSSPTITGCRIGENHADNGGGVYLSGSSPTITGCRVENNRATALGGGVYLSSSSPSIADCTIDSNAVWDGTGDTYGGGMYLVDSSPDIRDTRVEGNEVRAGKEVVDSWVDEEGHTWYSYEWRDALGGGLALVNSSPSLLRVVIDGNTAYGYATVEGSTCYECNHTSGANDVYGGGLYLEGSSPQLENCWITGNQAVTTEGLADGIVLDVYARGGGLFLRASDPTLTGCRIEGNLASATLERYGVQNTDEYAYADSRGGGMYLEDSSPVLSQGVVVDNAVAGAASGDYTSLTLVGGGVVVAGDSSAPGFLNAILAYNDWYNLYVSSGAPTVQYTDLYNPSSWTGNHNLSSLDPTALELEPGFLAYLDGIPTDLHLAADSPLIGKGGASVSDVDGSASDPGLYGGPTGDGWDLDLDGWFDYFWPGRLEQAPAGFDPADYDADDRDPEVQ